MTAEPPDEPRICLAVPFFANLGYLRVALQSLIAQTDPSWTGIVVDDASPEPGARELVAALDDPRLRYVRNEHNLGIAENFNRCLELASGDAQIVTVFHADDELEPDYVAAVRRAHRTFPTAACVAPRATVIDNSGLATHTLADLVKRVLWPRTLAAMLVGDRGLARLMHGLFFYCPAVSYRVDLLPVLRFDAHWRQVMDLDLYARVLLEGGTIVFEPERLYRYRRHGATMTVQNSRSLVRLDEEVAVCREVAAAARGKGWRHSYLAARMRPTVRLNGLLEAARLLAGRQMRAAFGAVRTAISR